MMGWRVGYIAYPSAPGGGGDGFLGAQLLKVQDTIPVCPPQLSQVGASDAQSRPSGRAQGHPCFRAHCVRVRDIQCGRPCISTPFQPAVRSTNAHVVRQVLALEAVHAGRGWVSKQVAGLEGNRRVAFPPSDSHMACKPLTTAQRAGRLRVERKHAAYPVRHVCCAVPSCQALPPVPTSIHGS